MVRSTEGTEGIEARKGSMHPPLTDIPIGAVVIAAALDVISAGHRLGSSTGHDAYRAATLTLMVGTAVLVLTVGAGFIDRARVSAPGTAQRKAINIHAAIMIVVGALCVADIVLRRHSYAAASHTPGAVLTLTLICLAVTLVGGALGGRLVHGAGVQAAQLTKRDA